MTKQHGTLLAKGWLLGIQFETLFSDGLYEQLGRLAIMQAEKMRQALQDKGYRIHMPSPANQISLSLMTSASKICSATSRPAFGKRLIVSMLLPDHQRAGQPLMHRFPNCCGMHSPLVQQTTSALRQLVPAMQRRKNWTNGAHHDHDKR
jgi:hypothetical protein